MLSAIVAMDKNRVIGKENNLPWHLPADLQRFKAITTGHTVIMGRKTYESIGKPLPNRTNIVVTRKASFQAPGCLVFSFAETQRYIEKAKDEVFVIGGATLYQQCLPLTDRIYLTLIEGTFTGDTFFPELEDKTWTQTSCEYFPADEKNPYPHQFIILVRNCDK